MNESSGRESASDAEPSWTKENIVGVLQRASALIGDGLVTGPAYERVRAEVGGPSTARIIQRFGSWRGACLAAGVPTSAAPIRTYRKSWDRYALAAVVAEFLDEEGSRGSYAEFEAWARDKPDSPSGATVRNVFGSWSAAKAAAQEARGE